VTRAAILSHGYIPHFRVRLYELLAERGEVEYVVFHGAPPSWIGVPELPGPFTFPQRRIENREFRVGPATLIHQPVVREILTGGYDAVILTTEAKFISNLVLALFGRLRGIAVLFWGFGYQPVRGFRDSDQPHPAVRVVNFVKDALVKHLAAGYLAYTRAGRDSLVASGFPSERVFVLQNTIDMAEQFRLHRNVQAEDEQEIWHRLGLRPDSIVFVQIGRLVQFKRVDLLIEAVRRINHDRLSTRPVEAVVIGSGPLEDELKAQASDVPGIHFLGALPPNEEIARCLKVAAAVVIGGLVGLVVNHALAHGRPVITIANRGQSPELEYIVDDENGLVIHGGIGELAAVLARLADSAEWQARLAEGALRSREALRIEVMAENLDQAVRTTIARRRATSGNRQMPAPLRGE
jgi:glycosyltransferase involved in cell wall biosynthesis